MAEPNYFNSLKNHLRLDPTTESDLMRELHAHIEDESHELEESGLSEQEAIETATQFLGSPRVIAKQMYEVHSQGSWRQALFAALPHFLIAALFALHWWQSLVW